MTECRSSHQKASISQHAWCLSVGKKFGQKQSSPELEKKDASPTASVSPRDVLLSDDVSNDNHQNLTVDTPTESNGAAGSSLDAVGLRWFLLSCDVVQQVKRFVGKATTITTMKVDPRGDPSDRCTSRLDCSTRLRPVRTEPPVHSEHYNSKLAFVFLVAGDSNAPEDEGSNTSLKLNLRPKNDDDDDDVESRDVRRANANDERAAIRIRGRGRGKFKAKVGLSIFMLP